MRFAYHPDLLRQFPNVCGGVLRAIHVTNGMTTESLANRYRTEQETVRARLDTPLSEIPSLAAWRSAFRSFGTNPTKQRSAAEALLRRLDKKGDIPMVSTLVDIGNLVSIRYALPVAVFDTERIAGGITVRCAAGNEPFVELDNRDVVYPEPGEVIFIDDAGQVVARRWCWRQSAPSAVRPLTTQILVTVEAQHQEGRADIESALVDLETLLQYYAGGTVTKGIVDAKNRIFDDQTS